MKNIILEKFNFQKIEKQDTDLENKHLAYIYLTKDCYLEYVKNHYNSVIRRKMTIKKWLRDVNRPFIKEDI